MPERFRETDKRRITTLSTRCTTQTGLPVSPPYNSALVVNCALEGEKRSIADFVHDNYRARKREGQIIMGNVDLVVEDRQQSSGTCQGYIPEWKETWNATGDLTAGIEWQADYLLPGYVGQFGNQLGQLALIEAYAKMNGPRVTSGSEVLLDLNSTIGMLRKPFSSAQDLCKKIVKARKRNLKRSGSNYAQANANAWLEYRYAWKPLLLDSEAIVDDALGFYHKSGKVLRLVSRSSKPLSISQSVAFLNQQGGGVLSAYLYDGTALLTEELVVSAGVIYDLVNRTGSGRFARDYGLTARDLPSIMWERIPYSFVVDWFVNVGDWIQAMMPNPDVSVLANWITWKTNTSRTVSGTIKRQLTTQGAMTGSMGISTRKYCRIYRSVNNPLPTLPVQTAGSLSATHSIDAMSLMCKSVLGLLTDFKKR